MKLLRAFALCLALIPGTTLAERLDTSAGPVEVSLMVSGLDEPWAVGFLPGGGVLITERAGRLLYFKDGAARAVEGVPAVFAEGQGGLLDVAVAADFARSREIFLTYSEPDGRTRGGTALAVAQLSQDSSRLENLRVLFRQERPSGRSQHFGSRVVEAQDGTLFFTIGDRGEARAAQDVARSNGKVLRVNRDGSIPADNPFVDKGLGAVWSFGHRNPQGAALDGDGRLWTVEHGARGGDEINRIEAGRNYGWPVISYGTHYSGQKIGMGTSNPGMEQPLFYWDPSIAPSGLTVYSGRLWPEWRGNLMTGSLKFDYISRVAPGENFREAERLFEDRYTRIRDIREGPDGALWFLSVGDGGLYRVVPAQ